MCPSQFGKKVTFLNSGFRVTVQKARLSKVHPTVLNVWSGVVGAVVCTAISAIAEDMRFSEETDDIIFVGQ